MFWVPMFSYSPRCKIMVPPFSHGGYDPKTGQFGTCRRPHTENKDCRPTCGRINSISKHYQDEYRFAAENIMLCKRGDEFLITIDSQLLKESREEDLFLKKQRFIATHGDGSWQVVQAHSTARIFRLISIAVERLGEQPFPFGDAACSGDKFPADWFYCWHKPD